jgi:hypothetical protein
MHVGIVMVGGFLVDGRTLPKSYTIRRVNVKRRADGRKQKRSLLHAWAGYPELIGMEVAGMNVAKDSAAFKSIQVIAELAEALKQFMV